VSITHELGGSVTLGRTGLKVGRLGISSSYGAPARAFEAAFERGCNYWTWGTFVRGRSSAMRDAVRSVVAKGKREDLVLGVITYAHWAALTAWRLRRGLKALGTDYVDVLLLGYYAKVPSRRTLEAARKLQTQGVVRHIGITSHNRKMFQHLEEAGGVDVIHVRYNATHRGAEQDVFPHVAGADGPGVVSFTATDWGRLLSGKRMPPGEEPASAADCYRFVLSHPAVDVCMTGTKSLEQMRENLDALDQGPMSEEELRRMRHLGDHLYGRARPR
jgi:aryl-alcohol dehydrogenase-like predicted oxidoreductase